MEMTKGRVPQGPQDVDALVRRMARMERRARWSTIALGAVIAASLVLSPLLSSDSAASRGRGDTLTAKKLALLDDEGRVRILLTAGTGDRGPSVTLLNAAQKPGVVLSYKTMPAVSVFNTEGKTVGELNANPTTGGLLLLKGPRGDRVTFQKP